MGDIHQQWDELVTGIIRRAKKLPPDAEVKLPDGSTGNYIKYALDKHGRLSTDKPKGRIKPHRTPQAIEKSKLTQRLFGVYLTSLFKKAKAEAELLAPSCPAIKPITQDDVTVAQRWAAARAEELVEEPLRARKKAARLRRKTSRRINAGIIPGNWDKRSHAEA